MRLLTACGTVTERDGLPCQCLPSIRPVATASAHERSCTLSPVSCRQITEHTLNSPSVSILCAFPCTMTRRTAVEPCPDDLVDDSCAQDERRSSAALRHRLLCGTSKPSNTPAQALWMLAGRPEALAALCPCKATTNLLVYLHTTHTPAAPNACHTRQNCTAANDQNRRLSALLLRWRAWQSSLLHLEICRAQEAHRVGMLEPLLRHDASSCAKVRRWRLSASSTSVNSSAPCSCRRRCPLCHSPTYASCPVLLLIRYALWLCAGAACLLEWPPKLDVVSAP